MQLKPVAYIIVSGVIIFPMSILLNYFDLLQYIPNLLPEDFIVEKTSNFLTTTDAKFIKEQNILLLKALVVPYYMILLWLFTLIFLVILLNIKVSIDKKLSTKMYVAPFVTVILLMFLSYRYSINDLRISRSQKYRDYDYSQSMNLEAYASWQINLYLLGSSAIAILCLIMIVSMFSYNKVKSNGK